MLDLVIEAAVEPDRLLTKIPTALLVALTERAAQVGIRQVLDWVAEIADDSSSEDNDDAEEIENEEEEKDNDSRESSLIPPTTWQESLIQCLTQFLAGLNTIFTRTLHLVNSPRRRNFGNTHENDDGQSPENS